MTEIYPPYHKHEQVNFEPNPAFRAEMVRPVNDNANACSAILTIFLIIISVICIHTFIPLVTVFIALYCIVVFAFFILMMIGIIGFINEQV